MRVCVRARVRACARVCVCERQILGGDFTDVCVVLVVSPFIRALFPENLEAEKRGRPSTASTKIKVSERCQSASEHWLVLSP